ncbi:MAG: PEGA domain-containing protein [Deltaproteobacteria bacterium]|nr:PEGA domain-containing protein [Deltaproteobacteria bacterium]
MALAPVAAAQGAGDEAEEIKVAIILIGQDGAERADETMLTAGMRRGLRNIERLDDEHPADILTDHQQSDEVYATIQEEPDAIAQLLVDGQARQAEARAAAALEIFEDNLIDVKRSMLADVYALLGVAQCLQRGRREDCRATFQRVVTFREHFYYDIERYPARFETFFNNVQTELIDGNLRGAIEVVTDPPGAEVFVDGRSIGGSPVVAETLLVGDHYLTVKAIGFEKQILRVTVEDSYQATADVVLETSRSALQITQLIEDMPGELGEPLTGLSIGGVRTLLMVRQVVAGIVTPSGEDRLALHLYLYDLKTRHLLSELEVTVSRGEEGLMEAEALVAELYDGVDLSGVVAAPDLAPDIEDNDPIFVKWWFWTAVAVVIGGIIAIGAAAASGGGEQLPNGWYPATGTID